jgi:hypothetical protein
MAIFEHAEQVQASKGPGKDQTLTPSPNEARDAQAFFDDIAKKEKANSKLPNLTFKTVAEGSTYVLKELSKDPSSDVTTVKEIAQFQEYTNGYKSTRQLEASVPGANGSKVARETEQITTPTAASTKVFESPADAGPLAMKETYEKVSTMKDGKELSSVTATFGYSDKTGKANAETIVAHNADGTTTTQVFGGEGALKIQSDLLTGADGKELQRSTMEDILNDKKEVVGRRQTVVQHNKGNTTTTTFEGAADSQLKASQQVVAYDNGKIETYKANAKGDLVLVK